MSFFKALYKFSRPHTIIGTTLSAWCLWKMAENIAVTDFLILWIATLCANLYIVGLNQLCDIEIDKQNKPDLPLVSQEMSIKTGQILVFGSGFLSLILGFYGGFWLSATIIISLLIGTAYSVEPIRLKRFHLTAALCILLIRGFVVHFGFYLSFNGAMPFPPKLYALAFFMLFFSMVIAWLKDVPDVEGDKNHQIKTLALQVGQMQTLKTSVYLLIFAYIGLILFLYASGFLLLAALHLLPMAWLLFKFQNITKSQLGFKQFYLFIWILFYLEYLLFGIL